MKNDEIEYTGVWELKLTPEDLNTIESEVRSYWVNTNQDKQLPGTGKSITDSQLRTLAWMNACIGVLARKTGIGSITFRLDNPDLEPDTEP